MALTLTQTLALTLNLTQAAGVALRTPGAWCATGHRRCADPAYAEHGILAVPVRDTLNGNRSDTYGFLPWFILPCPPGCRAPSTPPRGGGRPTAAPT